MEHSSLNTPSPITKEKKRGRKRLLIKYCFVCVAEEAECDHQPRSDWLWPRSSYTLLLGSHVRRWNTGWSMWTSCFGFVAGVCDSSQKSSLSNTWSGQVSPFWPLGALELRATVLHLQVSGWIGWTLDQNHLWLYTTEPKRVLAADQTQ